MIDQGDSEETDTMADSVQLEHRRLAVLAVEIGQEITTRRGRFHLRLAATTGVWQGPVP